MSIGHYERTLTADEYRQATDTSDAGFAFRRNLLEVAYAAAKHHCAAYFLKECAYSIHTPKGEIIISGTVEYTTRKK